jgi:hypothetical protein
MQINANQYQGFLFLFAQKGQGPIALRERITGIFISVFLATQVAIINGVTELFTSMNLDEP